MRVMSPSSPKPANEQSPAEPRPITAPHRKVEACAPRNAPTVDDVALVYLARANAAAQMLDEDLIETERVTTDPAAADVLRGMADRLRVVRHNVALALQRLADPTVDE